MNTRSLPKRSTRGQLPPRLRAATSAAVQPRKRRQPQSEEQRQRRQMELVRNCNKQANMRLFPFPRVVHYFYDLTLFKRVRDHPSYVYHLHDSLLSWTYRHDSDRINGTPLSTLLNRKFFQLPKQDRILLQGLKLCNKKNICQGHLFQTEDKKHNCDRLIYTFKIILKKLNQASFPSIVRSQIIRKDGEFSKLVENGCRAEELQGAISQRVDFLQARKQVNLTKWANDDADHFQHSLNQQLHSRIHSLEKQLLLEGFLNIYYRREYIQEELANDKLNKSFFDRYIKYYGMDQSFLSQKAKKNLHARIQAEEQISFPLAVISFGHKAEVHQMAALAMGRRSMSLSEAHFYECQSIVYRFIGRKVTYEPERQYPYEQYQREFRNCLKMAGSNLSVHRGAANNQPILDEFFSGRKGHLPNLLNLGAEMQITIKEMRMVVIYFWLLEAINDLYPFLVTSPDLLHLITSDYFPKVGYFLTQAAGTPLSGLIPTIYDSLADTLSKPQLSSPQPMKLVFQFNANKQVGAIYKLNSQRKEQVDCLEGRKGISCGRGSKEGRKKVKRE